MCCHESSVESHTLLFEQACHYLYSGIAKHGYTASADFGERILASYDYAWNAAVYDQSGAWRRLAVVGTGFEGDVYGAPRQLRSVFYGGYGIDFGMTFATPAVIPFSYDFSVVADYYCAYHRIWRCSSMPHRASCKARAI